MITVKPIKTDADHKAALARAWDLMDAGDGPDGDELDVLSTLIVAYENEHYPVDLPDPIDAIQFRLEQQGLTRKDLEPIIGSRGRVSEVMNRRRGLSIDMIRRLNATFGISAEVLIQPTKAEAKMGFAEAVRHGGTKKAHAAGAASPERVKKASHRPTRPDKRHGLRQPEKA